MGKLDGPSTTAGGVLNGNIGTALVAGDVVLGAGWGSAATKTITAGSNGQRGQIVVTASTTTPAQATATIVITFPHPYTSAPFCINKSTTNTNSLTAAFEFTCVTTTTTATFLATVLPVDTKLYTLDYAFSL
jgi:hypothetical protein